MDDYRKEAIAKRAYELWEKSDRAHGRQDEHWRQAEQEFEDRELAEDGKKNVTDALGGEESMPISAAVAGRGLLPGEG